MHNLRASGATEVEIRFLLTRRVELNAFASDKFIEWIERKLEQHGIKNLIPDETTLGMAYRRIRQQAAVQKVIDAALTDLVVDNSEVPDSLANLIGEIQAADSSVTWDEALKRVVLEVINGKQTD